MKPKVSFQRSSVRLWYYRYRDSSLYTMTFLLVAGLVSLFLFTRFIIPQIQEWFSVRREVADTKQKIVNINQNIKYLSSLDQANLDAKFQTALHTVPEQSDFAGIITAINAASIKSNVLIDQFSFVPGKVDPEKSSGLQTVRLTVALKGTVGEIRTFLSELADKVPLTRVLSVTIDREDAAITFLFHFKALPDISVDRTQLLQLNADSNAALLKQLNEWDKDTQTFQNVSFTASASAFTSPF